MFHRIMETHAAPSQSPSGTWFAALMLTFFRLNKLHFRLDSHLAKSLCLRIDVARAAL